MPLTYERPIRDFNSSHTPVSQSKFDEHRILSESDDDFDFVDEHLASSDEEPEMEQGFTSQSSNSNADSLAINPSPPHQVSNHSDVAKRKYSFKKRKPNPRGLSDLRDRWNDRVKNLHPEELGNIKCCKKLQCFRTLNKEFLINKIKLFMIMTPSNRRKALAGMYGSAGKFFFDGQQVCANFLFQAFRFSRMMQASVRLICERSLVSPSENGHLQSLNEGRGIPSNPNSVTILQSPAREAIISYLTRLADTTGDKMPDSEERHLPFHSKNEVFDHFKEEFKRTTSPTLVGIPSQPYFLRVWKRDCRIIKVRKNNRFSKCEICERLKDEMKRAVTNFESTNPILAQKKAHYAMIAEERQEYKRKRDMAILNPTEVLSCIIDGADQRAFGLPHFISHTKAERGHALTIKLVGVLEHALENRLRLLTMTEEHQTGANHIVESIHRFLMDKSLSSTIPPKLCIQVDNCTRENKNRFFFAYIESLVRWKLFHEVEVGFLPVGHTHEDIDQAFSTTSARLRVHEAVTLNDLLFQLRQVYNSHTSVVHMKNIINWSGLCHQERILTTVKNFSTYRFFKFRRGEGEISNNQETDQPIQCTVKVNLHDEWEPLKTSFITRLPKLCNTPPTMIASTNNKDFNKMKSNFTKRLESEESRIQVPSKIGELKELRDSIFRTRKIKFHWDLERAVELRNLKGNDSSKDINSKSNHDDHVAGSDSDSSSGITPAEGTGVSGSCLASDYGPTLQNKIASPAESYTYEANSFVAVLAETADKNPSFWVGKVINTKPDKAGTSLKIMVHWFEPYNRKENSDNSTNKFFDKYAPSYLERGTGKERPWVNSIDTSTVLLNFSSLLHNRRLPAAVQRHLRIVLPKAQK